MKVNPQGRVVAVLVSAIMIAAAGGAMMAASNMGFKIVRPIVFEGTGQIGSNWIALPFKNPYTNAQDLCQKTGLTTGLFHAAQIQSLDPVTGSTTSVSCSSASSLILVPGRGIKIRQPDTTGAPTSIFISGSHDNNLSLTIPAPGAGQIGNFWYAVPYHATAVTAQDLCNEIGLSSGLLIKAQIQRLDPTTGSTTTGSCGTSSATNLVLQIGEAVMIREPNGPKTFTPAHY